MVNNKLADFNEQLRDSIYLLERQRSLLNDAKKAKTNGTIADEIERVTPNGVRY